MDVSGLFMSRCLDLAAHGRGNVAPNPMVGAVIVADGVIVGEGYHHCYGEAHAEVNAIASVQDESLLRRATLYVNLEPCSHYGKTAPCAELIIRKKIPRVVVACLDPYPEVAGCGIRMLRDAGVDVVTGVMEREAVELNRFFLTAHRRQRPYIILKWAQSVDGFIDRKRKDASEKPTVFSTPLTRMMVHQLRSEVQAIMVGTHTAILDNPSLTVRYWRGNSPVRVLIDRNLRIPQGYHLLDGEQPTIVFTKRPVPSNASPNASAGIRNKKNVKYIEMNPSGFRLSDIAAILYENNVHSLLVEGGASLHRSFIEENLWDELIVETAPVRLEDGVKSVDLPFGESMQLVDRQFVDSCSTTSEKPSMIERFLNCRVLQNNVSNTKNIIKLQNM